MVIILTQSQANIVSGASCINPYAILSPVPLSDGTYMLGDSVLIDPNHVQHITLLSSLPTKSLEEVQALLPTIPD
jgi:hypothetical protein